MKKYLIMGILSVLLTSSVHSQETIVFQYEGCTDFSILDKEPPFEDRHGEYTGVIYTSTYCESIYGNLRISRIELEIDAHRATIYFDDNPYYCHFICVESSHGQGDDYIFEVPVTNGMARVEVAILGSRKRFRYGLYNFFPFIEEYAFSLYPEEKARLDDNAFSKVHFARRHTIYTGYAAFE
jgi:hypothetical protein